MLEVVWHAASRSSGWHVVWRGAGQPGWTESSSIARRQAIDREVWAAEIPAGRSGEAFEYQLRQGEVVRAAGQGRAPAPPGQPLRFAVTADVGDASQNQRAVVGRLLAQHQADPIDFGLIAGDVAYECGRRDEYAAKFYPSFNPMTGASLLSSVPFAVAAGNHDVGDLRWPLPPFRCTTDYSFFYFWRHPRGFSEPVPTGPRHGPPAPSARPPGPAVDLRRMLAAANYSFTWGDAHVTVIDSNRYVNWADPALRQWLESDLAAAGRSRWRFVLLHHPPFNRSSEHGGDQWTRYLAPIFERHDVTAVLSGHVHNFQWFGPLRFVPDPAEVGRFAVGSRGRLSGTLEAQPDYDGQARSVARWPIYLVSGAAGSELSAEGSGCPSNVVAPGGCGPPPVKGLVPSVTIVEVRPEAVVIRQIAATGSTLLERRVTRPLPTR